MTMLCKNKLFKTAALGRAKIPHQQRGGEKGVKEMYMLILNL